MTALLDFVRWLHWSIFLCAHHLWQFTTNGGSYDVYLASSATSTFESGCYDEYGNYGNGILSCYGCSRYWPADWSPQVLATPMPFHIKDRLRGVTRTPTLPHCPHNFCGCRRQCLHLSPPSRPPPRFPRRMILHIHRIDMNHG